MNAQTRRDHRARFPRRIRVLLFRGPFPGEAAARFREQMTYLDHRGYTPITLNDYRLIRAGELPPPRRPVILTFEGWTGETFALAVPVMQEFGMKGVVFAAPEAGSLTAEELLELHQAGFEIGSASLTGARLTALPHERAWEEISRSRMMLEITLNAPVRAFAYPPGDVTQAIKEMVAAAGYEFACAGESGPTTIAADPLEIGRIAVPPLAGPAELALRITAPASAARWLRGRARTRPAGNRTPAHAGMAKTLLLVSAGIQWPGKEEAARREAEDLTPRILPLVAGLNADILDERFLERAPRWRSRLYRASGVGIAQVLEAFRARRRYDVIVSWAEHLGLPLAGLFRLTGATARHVSIFSWISKPKKARILKAVHHSIDRIILMSSAQHDFAVNTLGIPPGKIALLRWPVDEKFWRPMGSPVDTIASVGREMRDFRTLIEALRGTPIPCHIAAGGQLALEKADPWMRDISGMEGLPATVTIGGMGFPDLRRLYDRSRFVVIPLFPTDTDNGTTSILEAMAMGKAVICSRVAGQRDVIREGYNGLFVPPGDVRALRDAIEYLWTHPDRAAEMGRNGRKHVEQHHALDPWITEVQQVVAGVLARGGDADAAASVSVVPPVRSLTYS